MHVRPMRGEDVDAAVALSGTGRPAVWRARVHHLLRTDPAGCWVADDGTDVIGCAVALRRDLLWALASLHVRADARGRGVGRALLDAALQHSRGCLRGMIASSEDPAAARRYRLAGFALHPVMALRGTVDRSALPVVPGVRSGGLADLELVDSVDRQARGAARRPDHALLLSEGVLLVADSLTGRGYAVVAPDQVLLLAATTRRVATSLLWEALARTAPGQHVDVGHLTAEQDWAVDVGLAARLSVLPDGWLCLRRMRPPRFSVPHPALL